MNQVSAHHASEIDAHTQVRLLCPSHSLSTRPNHNSSLGRYSSIILHSHGGNEITDEGRAQDEEIRQGRTVDTAPHTEGQEVLSSRGRSEAKEGMLPAQYFKSFLFYERA